jgi:hypothetical protein
MMMMATTMRNWTSLLDHTKVPVSTQQVCEVDHGTMPSMKKSGTLEGFMQSQVCEMTL